MINPVTTQMPQRIMDWLAILSVSFFLLSSWGPLLLNVSGMYVAELPLGAVLLYLRYRRPSVFHDLLRCMTRPVGVGVAFWLWCVAILGVIRTGSVVGPYSEFRSSLIVVWAFFYFFRCGSKPGGVRILHQLAVSALCFDFASELVRLSGIAPSLYGVPEHDSSLYAFGRASVPAITIVLAAYLSAQRRHVQALFLIVFLGGIASFGGHRLVLLATLLMSLLIPVLGMRAFSEGKIRRLAVLTGLALVVTGGVVVAIGSGRVEDYMESSPGIRYRLIDKTADTIAALQGGGGSLEKLDAGAEASRLAYLSFLLDRYPYLLLPHGLGSRETLGMIGAGFEEVAHKFGVDPAACNTHDMGPLYFGYHHGLLAYGTACSVFLVLAIRRMLLADDMSDRLVTAIGLGAVLLIDMFFPSIPGISLSFMYGSMLGVALNPWAFASQARKTETGACRFSVTGGGAPTRTT